MTMPWKPRRLARRVHHLRELTRPQRSITTRLVQMRERGEPLNLAAVVRRHPALVERVFSFEPPWGWRRALADAGIDALRVRMVVEQTVRCEICDVAFKRISATHLRKHGSDTASYREAYPAAEIDSEAGRAGAFALDRRTGAASRGALPHWDLVWTPAYVLDRLVEFQRAGLPLNADWLHDNEPSLLVAVAKCFGTLDSALSRVGIDPETTRERRKWTDERLAQELRTRAADGKSTKVSVLRRERHGLVYYALGRFGTWAEVLAFAGLKPQGPAARGRKRS